MYFQALAVHTERIHDPLVWKRLRLVLSVLNRKGSHATLFVYPFRSIVVGKSDIALQRVEQAWRDGHEIAQHTHFYKGQLIEKPNKITDLSEDNVVYCLQRDYEWLNKIIAPRGFTSGGWAVPPALYPALTELGFEYDCSARHLILKGTLNGPHVLWLDGPELRRLGQNELLLIPTTHNLKGALFFPRHSLSYQLVYFHDYDLLRWEVYFAALIVALTKGRWMTCRELANHLKGGDRG